jgi:hypothetical protein
MKCTRNSLLCCTAIVMGMTMPVSAETLFDGTIKITAVTAACTQGPSVGDYTSATFHPRSVTGGTQTRSASGLNMLWDTGARTWVVENADFTSTFQQTTTNWAINWTAFMPQKPSFVKIISSSPATFTTTTQTVSLYGQIRNFYGLSGQENCIATFRMVGILNVR